MQYTQRQTIHFFMKLDISMKNGVKSIFMVNRMAATIPCRMFSQRGSTCGTDTIYTILFEADPIRRYFVPLLTHNPRTLIASKDDLVAAMGYAIQRRNKMLSLPPPPPSPPKLLRCDSLNTGEGKEMLSRSTMGDTYGVTFESVVSLLDDLLVRDYFNVLPPSMKIQISHMRIPEDTRAAKNIKSRNVFAIILGIDYFMRPSPSRTYNSNNNNEKYSRKYYRYKGGNLTRCTYGHEVGFLQQDDDWYFVDNIVGWLHKITDSEFVPVHVLNTLQKGEPIHFLQDESNWEKQRNFIIMADGVTYGGEPFSLEESHYKTTEVHVVMSIESVKGGRTRRSTRYSARRRASRRC